MFTVCDGCTKDLLWARMSMPGDFPGTLTTERSGPDRLVQHFRIEPLSERLTSFWLGDEPDVACILRAFYHQQKEVWEGSAMTRCQWKTRTSAVNPHFHLNDDQNANLKRISRAVLAMHERLLSPPAESMLDFGSPSGSRGGTAWHFRLDYLSCLPWRVPNRAHNKMRGWWIGECKAL